MGIRLAEDTVELAEGNYIVRIGDKAGNIVEIEFAVGAEETIVLAELDGDGEITGNDGLSILNYLAKKVDFTDNLKIAAELDADGEITGNDALSILNYLAKKIEKFPVEG